MITILLADTVSRDGIDAAIHFAHDCGREYGAEVVVKSGAFEQKYLGPRVAVSGFNEHFDELEAYGLVAEVEAHIIRAESL